MFTRGNAFATWVGAFGLVLAGIAGCTDTRPPGLQVAHQALGETIGTDKSAYVAGEDILVTTGGMPGNAYDWIAIAPLNSDLTVFSAWQYTGGDVSNTYTMSSTGLAVGSYVVRAFLNDGYTLLAESGFSIVQGNGVVTDQTTYAGGAPVTVSYIGMPGTATDWIAIATPGAPNNSFYAFQYTPGTPDGQVVFNNLPAGTYVARAFPMDSYQLLYESAQFTVGSGGGTASITGGSPYANGAPILASYSGFPGGGTDWVALWQGSSLIAWNYVAGSSGEIDFGVRPAGDYEIRGYSADSYNLIASYALTVQGVVGSPAITGASPYASDVPVTASFSNFPNSGTDWVGLYLPGDPDTSFISYQYVSGASGGVDFGVRAPGDYELRGFSANSYNLIATYALTVQGGTSAPSLSIALDLAGSGVDVTYANFPSATDWIGLALEGSAPGTFVQFKYATGSGTVNFGNLAPGSYIARAYSNDTYNLMAEALTPVAVAGGTATVTAGQSSFLPGQPMSVSFTGFPGSTVDWIGIYPIGASINEFISWTYTGGGTSGGPLMMTAPVALGSYELRGYRADGSPVPATFAFSVFFE